MFLDYYGLREQPFGVTPDPRFLYFGTSHREALASLYYGVESGRGFLALIAKPGMGKTTLLFHLLGKLRYSSRTAFLFQTQCDSRQFLRSLLTDLGVECRESDDLFRLQSQLNEVLVRETQAGRRFVLVVDEAQNLEDSVLETLRMLSNFETPRAKLMQIILAGQPQLASKLASDRLVQLRQRVSIISRLNQLTAAETAEYIDHRLLVAGYTGKPLFGSGELERIASASEGIPRNINNLCFNALTLAFARSAKRIEGAILEEVLADLSLEMCVPTASPVPVEEKPIVEPAPLRTAPAPSLVAHSSQESAKPRELPLARLTARRLAALDLIGSKVRNYSRVAVARASRLWAQSTPSFRRAGAGLVTISTVCGAGWLALGSTRATTQPMETISIGVQSRNILAEKTSQPSSPVVIADQSVNVARIRPSGAADPSKVQARKRPSIALFAGMRGEDRINLDRLQSALKIAPTIQPTVRQATSERETTKEFARRCSASDFSIVRVDNPENVLRSAASVSEDPWDARGRTNLRCASVDGALAKRH